MYNMMTCQGPDWSMAILGGCSQAWIVFIIVLFLVLVVRRQCDDGLFAGTAFNFWLAIVVGLGGLVLLITLTGEAKWGFLAGLIGVGVGGFGGGLIFDTTGGGGGEDYNA